MATKIEQLETEHIEKLREFQGKSNDIIVSLGQISVKTRELNLELKRLEGVKENYDLEFDKNADELETLLKQMEVKYPKGEIDLKEGIVIFDDGQ